MKRVLKFLFLKTLRDLAQKFSSAPDKGKVHKALDNLLRSAHDIKDKHSLLLDISGLSQSVIIFSDQHKGARNAKDDFKNAEKNYLAALAYYDQEKYYLINLGDSEELWKNPVNAILKNNREIFSLEKKFIQRQAFSKVIGNHDLMWKEDPLAPFYLKNMYGKSIPVFESVVIHYQKNPFVCKLLCTHGHQGDRQSDGNAFSKWFVSRIWGPLQSFFELNPNTPSCNNEKKSLHNEYMYEWSSRQNDLLLITGHTHQPVFKSLTHLERLYLDLENAIAINDIEKIKKIEQEIPRRKAEYNIVNESFRQLLPYYFNSGCCCFDDGTITGIELKEGEIMLIKWSYQKDIPQRTILERITLEELFKTTL
ncbi:MAG: metallophosphoesterase family protein [Bacteroidetes bacterium]|nr:metallophosphoesterase family protein [Bacteroidota bacterium]